MPAPDFLTTREHLNDDIAAHHNQESSMSIVSEIITVTPDDARRFLSKMVHNRPLSMANVKAYTDEINAGRWGLNGQGIIFDSHGRLLDGQHRMHAVIKSGKAIKTLVIRNVSADMFSRMDVGNKRTVADVIDVKNRNTVAGACKFLYREMRGVDWWNSNHRPRPIDGVDIIKAHPGIVESVAVVRPMKGAQRFAACSVLGYCHYRAGKESVERRDQFFASLDTGADLGVRSPLLALRNALAPVAGTRTTDVHQISLIICSWRTFLAGGQCKFLRLPNVNPQWGAPL
jgi:hypothetical protein